MSSRFALAILSIVSLWFPSVSALADFESGAAAYTRGDYATALEEWKPLAEAGNVASQFNLGLMYYNGKGTRLDFSEAAKWFRLAAEKGDAAAQINLGVMYFNGEGVDLDFEQAHFWFTMAVRLFPPGSEREQAARNLAIAGGNLTAAQISENERKAEALRQEFVTAVPEPAGAAVQPAVKPAPEAAEAPPARMEGPRLVSPGLQDPRRVAAQGRDVAEPPAAATAEAPIQQAAIPPEPAQQADAAPPVQAPEPSSARRFVIQLASLNDTDTAMAEKTRPENKYAELLGEVELSVQQAELD
ncbi:MAG: tetratricopeptide repeat protein, partial [Alphaproteobacteria bacterium]